MLPSKTFNRPWIDEFNTKYKNCPTGGKWMMFYNMNEIDDIWQNIKYMYNSDKLTGVHSLRVSTNFKNTSDKMGVIMCYCGKPQQKKEVMECGKNLVQLTNYKSESGYIYYKADKKILGFKKSLYKIKVEKIINEEDLKLLNTNLITVELPPITNKQPDYYIFIDTETTGSSGPNNFIIQLAYIIVNSNFEIVKIVNKYINHKKCKITRSAYDVHKINNTTLDIHGYTFEEVFIEFLKDMVDVKYVVGHNIKFDVGMVIHNLGRYNFEIIDPFINKQLLCTCLLGKYVCCIKNVVGKIKLPKLGELYKKLFNKNIINAHDALVDTIACMDCFIKIKKVKINRLTQMLNNKILLRERTMNRINRTTDIYEFFLTNK